MRYPYALDDYIAEVIGYMQDNGVKRPHVIAHSFGGRIAIKAAASYPDLFDKIILTGAAGLRPKRSFSYYKKRIGYLLKRRFVSKEKLEKYFSEDYKKLSPVMKESFKKIVNEYLDGYLSGVNNPTLLLWGKEDRETPLYMAKRIVKGIKNSELITLNGGHFCFIDDPVYFNKIADEFFKEEQNDIKRSE